ncbi:MAG: hypothetical protein J6D11_02270 [Clostridia bacterium]|nr:hypothetical protein [Clostridia bacterium]
MENTKKSTKKLVIIIAALLAALLIIVPLVVILAARSTAPIDFLMKKDLSKYVDFEIPEKIEYDEIKEAISSGYDVFRVGLTESYFGSEVYVEEGSTLDFTLSAELVNEVDGTKEYTDIVLPEEYAKIVGYRPFSKEENIFFDKALAEAGNLDDYSQHYISKNTATKFELTVPMEERFGEYAGKNIRFTITVTDYVCRYIYLYDGYDNSISTVADWYCKIVTSTAQKSGGKIEEGDIVLYDCTDILSDGTTQTYTDLCLEATGDYLKYFKGYSEGDTFTEEFSDVTENFTVKGVYKEDDAKNAVKALGYNSVFELKEELRIWCYAVYSDGFMLLATQSAEVLSYPKNLLNTYNKLEDATWETEFRENAASFAETLGDETALETYGITGYETIEDYLNDLLDDHVKTLVGELMSSFAMAKEFGVLEELHERYEKSLASYIVNGGFANKQEALEALYANGDEACVFYSNFLSPILGTKFAQRVTGAPFAEYIADSYVSY